MAPSLGLYQLVDLPSPGLILICWGFWINIMLQSSRSPLPIFFFQVLGAMFEQRAHTRPRGGSNEDDGMHTFLLALQAESHYPRLVQRGLTLRSLANLSADDLQGLGLPRGPLVRIRAALASGLRENVIMLLSDQQQSTAPVAENPWQPGKRLEVADLDGAAFLRASSEPLATEPGSNAEAAIQHPNPSRSSVGAIGGHRSPSVSPSPVVAGSPSVIGRKNSHGSLGSVQQMSESPGSALGRSTSAPSAKSPIGGNHHAGHGRFDSDSSSSQRVTGLGHEGNGRGGLGAFGSGGAGGGGNNAVSVDSMFGQSFSSMDPLMNGDAGGSSNMLGGFDFFGGGSSAAAPNAAQSAMPASSAPSSVGSSQGGARRGGDGALPRSPSTNGSSRGMLFERGRSDGSDTASSRGSSVTGGGRSVGTADGTGGGELGNDGDEDGEDAARDEEGSLEDLISTGLASAELSSSGPRSEPGTPTKRAASVEDKSFAELASALRVAEEAEFEASRRYRRAERDRDEVRAQLERVTGQGNGKGSEGEDGSSQEKQRSAESLGKEVASLQQRLSHAEKAARLQVEETIAWKGKCDQAKAAATALRQENEELRRRVQQLMLQGGAGSSSQVQQQQQQQQQQQNHHQERHHSFLGGSGNSGGLAGLGGGVGSFQGLGCGSGPLGGPPLGSRGGSGGCGLPGFLGCGGSRQGSSAPSSSLGPAFLAQPQPPSFQPQSGRAPAPLAATMTMGLGGDVSRGGAWTCKHCTFQNNDSESGQRVCELCNMTSA